MGYQRTDDEENCIENRDESAMILGPVVMILGAYPTRPISEVYLAKDGQLVEEEGTLSSSEASMDRRVGEDHGESSVAVNDSGSNDIGNDLAVGEPLILFHDMPHSANEMMGPSQGSNVGGGSGPHHGFVVLPNVLSIQSLGSQGFGLSNPVALLVDVGPPNVSPVLYMQASVSSSCNEVGSAQMSLSQEGKDEDGPN